MTVPISVQRWQSSSPHAKLFGTQQKVSCSVLVAHPNDEIVAAGCLLKRLQDVRVIHVSNGTPKQPRGEVDVPYGERRKRDCALALAVAGITEDRIIDLDWCQFEVSTRMVELSRQLLVLFRKTSPQIVLTHAYEGGHPDHDATAFCTHAAVRLLRRSGLKPPVLFEIATYPAAHGDIKIPEFLHTPSLESTTLVLDRQAQQLKKHMLDFCNTERHILEPKWLSAERFREAPLYDFRLPPYFGTLHYEKFGWGLSGKQWRWYAREGLKKLFPASTRSFQVSAKPCALSHARLSS